MSEQSQTISPTNRTGLVIPVSSSWPHTPLLQSTHDQSAATADFDKNAAYQSLAAQEFRCGFSQLFEVEVWLPCAFPFTFRAADVAGNEVSFGSSVTLLEQLRRLNNESYRADAETLAKWKYDGAGSQDTFDQSAHFGLAMFLHHAQLSVEHRLPMKLDY